MSAESPGFFSRIGLAFSLFFKVLFDAVFAGRAAAQLTGAAAPEPPKQVPAPNEVPAPKAKVEAPPARPPETAALQLLSALQREGRFVDFIQEDVTGVSDADLGAAARLVHQGARKVVGGWFTIEAIWPGEEGAAAVVQPGFDARRIRLTGNVTGEPPFRGTLSHHGWRASDARLPSLSQNADATVLAPAEVEL